MTKSDNEIQAQAEYESLETDQVAAVVERIDGFLRFHEFFANRFTEDEIVQALSRILAERALANNVTLKLGSSFESSTQETPLQPMERTVAPREDMVQMAREGIGIHLRDEEIRVQTSALLKPIAQSSRFNAVRFMSLVIVMALEEVIEKWSKEDGGVRSYSI